jgi:elongation factor P--(R)-beta-lysine ligase
MTWHPTANLLAIKARAELLARVRHFFVQRKVLEVETPVLGLATVTNPCLQSITADNGYLQTSAAFYMQRMLAAGTGDIYQITKAFRKTAPDAHSVVEFSLLEWFRVGVDQWDLMEEVAQLLEQVLTCHHFEYRSYQSVFEEYLGLNPLVAEIEQLKFEAQQHLNVEMPRASKDDWLNLLMSYFIEPLLGQQTPVFIYDYPPTQARLASLNVDEKGAEVAESFQLYYRGISLASGYKALTDSELMQERFQQENLHRVQKGLRTVPLDGDFLQALAHGIPESACVSLGIDRLLMLQLRAEHIQDVVSFVRPS